MRILGTGNQFQKWENESSIELLQPKKGEKEMRWKIDSVCSTCRAHSPAQKKRGGGRGEDCKWSPKKKIAYEFFPFLFPKRNIKNSSKSYLDVSQHLILNQIFDRLSSSNQLPVWRGDFFLIWGLHGKETFFFEFNNGDTWQSLKRHCSPPKDARYECFSAIFLFFLGGEGVGEFGV